MGSLSTSLDGLLNGSTYVGSSPLVTPFSNPKLSNAGDFYDEEHLHFYMHYTKGGSVAYLIVCWVQGDNPYPIYPVWIHTSLK